MRHDSAMSEPAAAVILLYPPPGHEVDPQALHDLETHAAETYDAGVILSPGQMLSGGGATLLIGQWFPYHPDEVMEDLARWIDRVFFNLDWLQLDEVS